MTEAAKNIFLEKSDIDLLYDVATSVHAIHDLDEMINHALLKIKDVFHLGGTSIALHDREKHQFYFIRTVEEQTGNNADKQEQQVAEKWEFPEDYGIGGWVFKTEKSLCIEDVSIDERFANDLAIQQILHIESMVCTPLKTRKQFVGVLYAINGQTMNFTKKNLRLLEILSSIIAVAIENARLYGELQLHAKTLESENIRLKAELQERFNKQGIIASSIAMQRVFSLLDKVIATTTTVLIQGETGTGKELIAKAIHYNSRQKDKPFVAENCAALSESLLESELFGHVKGAFTGAINDKKGLFEQARGGTILLDEIADMSFAMQTKLLRTLQDGFIRPVGSAISHSVEFRLLAATNRDLAEEVKKGNFRKDLFYRIQAFTINLPPLRERMEDIPLLATFFLKKYTNKFGWPTVNFMPNVVDVLMQYDWPGNIRELEHEIERALTLAGKGNNIIVSYLAEQIRGSAYLPEPQIDPQTTLPEAVNRLERIMIINALDRTRGNRSKAAKILGVSRQTLLNKINRCKI